MSTKTKPKADPIPDIPRLKPRIWELPHVQYTIELPKGAKTSNPAVWAYVCNLLHNAQNLMLRHAKARATPYSIRCVRERFQPTRIIAYWPGPKALGHKMHRIDPNFSVLSSVAKYE